MPSIALVVVAWSSDMEGGREAYGADGLPDTRDILHLRCGVQAPREGQETMSDSVDRLMADGAERMTLQEIGG